jgi:succinoglycan biosynthesis protein ExoV
VFPATGVICRAGGHTSGSASVVADDETWPEKDRSFGLPVRIKERSTSTMELVYYRDPIGNFGDDLNGYVWEKLLPAHVFKAESTLLMGIGSIFNIHLAPLSRTQGKRVFVIGSGAGYGPLPPAWETWNILGVRGPLTAELIGRPDLAMTDSAALLASLPPGKTSTPSRDGILVMPHHNSISRGNWEQVAVQAGMTFVDPRWSVSNIMEHFSRAKLVITEAMHGAIVADTLRIPWLPIVITPDALPFKWTDWALSVDLKYEPVRISPSSAWEALFHRDLMRRAKRQGTVAPAIARNVEGAVSLIADFRQRYSLPIEETTTVDKGEPKKRWLRLLRSTLSVLDGRFIENAARQLRELAVLRQPYLSQDVVLSRRVDQLQEAVHQFVRAVG